MKKAILSLATLALMTGAATADIFVVNTTDERMTYEVLLPNGDTKTGEVKEDEGYGPTQTSLGTPDGKISTFKLMSESGGSGVEVKAPDWRTVMVAKVNGSLKVIPIAWNTDNGQTHKRQMALFNATDTALTFDIIDEKEVRKGITLAAGEAGTYDAKNGFGMGFQTLKFSDGQRLDNAAGSGDYNIIHLDKRSPGKLQVSRFGHITAPRNALTP